MMSDGSVKMRQLRTFNRYTKEGTGRKVMCNEKVARNEIDELECIDFCYFEEKINGVLMTCRHKNENEVFSKFSLDEKNFPNHSQVKHLFIVLGSDHGKGAFTMSLTLCCEMDCARNKLHFDEVVGEVDSSKDEIEILRPLVLKLRDGIIKCSISHSVGNMPVLIAINEVTNKK